jgi:hypothetical protein
MSKMDTEEIKLYCFYQRHLFDLSSKVEGLNENTNFVFLFAEADETRFIIQEEDVIFMYEIDVPDEPQHLAINADDSGDDN